MTQNQFTRWRRKAGLDFHVIQVLLLRSWSIIAGITTAICIPQFLTSTEQGYYYTFSSIIAINIFFELGLNQIVMQFVSHEVAHLTPTQDGKLEGKNTHLAKLGSIAKMIKRWYLAASILFAVAATAVGIYFFSRTNEIPTSSWLGIWLSLVFSTAIALWVSPRLAIMEGCGKVGTVARFRLICSVISYAGLWTSLVVGFGLCSSAIAALLGALFTIYWINYHGNIVNWLSSLPDDELNKINWKNDILPLQWRTALSWVSGYFIFNLFTPLVFSRQGSVEAGKLGLALTLFNAISTVGMSWINAKAPNLTMHISRGERRSLNSLFLSVSTRSVLFITVSSAIAVMTAEFLGSSSLRIISRLATPDILLALAISTCVNSIIFAAATYMRAHREEPMLVVSIVTGVLTATTAYVGSGIGVFPMMSAYAGVTLLIALPWTLWLFWHYFRRAI